MALLQMPNGEYVDIDPSTPPDVLNKIMARYPAATKGQQSYSSGDAPPSPYSQQDQDQIAQDRSAYYGALSGVPVVGDVGRVLSSAIHGATFHADDLIAAAGRAGTQGLYNAVTKGDIGEVGRSFQNATEAAKEYRADTASAHPLESQGGELAGAVLGSLLTPELGIAKGVTQGALRLGEGAAGLAGRGAAAAGAPGAATAITSAIPRAVAAATKFGENPFGRFVQPTIEGAISGAKYGGLQSAVDAVSNDPDIGSGIQDTLRGAQAGAIGGGAAGAAGGVLGGFGRILANRNPNNAASVAYGHIADQLDQSYNAATNKAITPEEIRNAVSGARNAGSDTNVSDVARALQGTTVDLSRDNKLYGDTLREQSEQRLAGAPDRYNTQLNQALDIAPGGPSAYGRGQEIKNDLKTSASDPVTGYDAVLNHNVWSPELDKFFSQPTPVVQDALRNAVTMVRNERDPITGVARDPHQLVPLLQKAGIDPASVGLTDPAAVQTSSILQASGRPYPAAATAAGGPATAKVPSMFALDAVKRNLNAIADQAFGSSSSNANRIGTAANNEQKLLKGLLTDAHAPYKNLIANQANSYEQADSLQHGTDFLNAMRNGKAEEWLANAKNNSAINKDDLRTGVADQLRNIPGGAAGLQGILQTPEQKAALSWVVDDPDKVNKLSNFLQYEARTNRTDTAVASGLPGNTLAPQKAVDSPIPYIIGETVRGLPFGAPSGLLRGINAARTVAAGGLTSDVKKQLASILASQGKDLPEQITKAKAYQDAMRKLGLKGVRAAGVIPSALTGFGQ